MPEAPENRVAQAAQLLLDVRRGAPRLSGLPAQLAPTTLPEAYAIQQLVLRGLGAGVGAWKVTMFDARHGICAPIAANTLLASPAQLSSLSTPTRNTSQFGIEPEIAFRMGADLPPRAAHVPGAVADAYSAAEVYAAVASAHAVIEIVVTRFVDADAVSQLERVADSFMNEALIVGPACNDWQRLALHELALQVQVDGLTVHNGRGGHPLGNPLLPLVWIANHLAALGVGLKRGEYVTTGSCNGIRYATPGQQVHVSFAELGAAQVRC
jgi:2-keto-4-pentenoate hydratase